MLRSGRDAAVRGASIAVQAVAVIAALTGLAAGIATNRRTRSLENAECPRVRDEIVRRCLDDARGRAGEWESIHELWR
jgi:hypothetical protein